MNKIVELVINFEDLEFEDLGVEIMSLVDQPAIAVNWLAFSEDFVVNPLPGEGEDEFISRCIGTEIESGYDSDQAAAICYSKWNEFDTTAFNEDEWLSAVLEQAKSDKYGIQLDENTIFIDGTKNQFDTVSDIAQGIRALDILDGEDINRQIEPRYRYRGVVGPNTRPFCAAMVALNKIYTKDEIDLMSDAGINGGFAERGEKIYSIFDYKGGCFCKHYWEKLSVFERNGRTVVISEGPAEGDAGTRPDDMPNNGRVNFWSFSEDDKMIITGPAMIPNQLIPRRDAMGNVFHVYFSKETIKNIAKKFLADQKAHNTDINHNDDVVNENTLLESWIVDDPKMDKAAVLGFNVPKDTWMVSYKINNKETWNKIKAGELNGFSVTGSFLEKIQS